MDESICLLKTNVSKMTVSQIESTKEKNCQTCILYPMKDSVKQRRNIDLPTSKN